MVAYALLVVAVLAAVLAITVHRAAPGRSVNRHFAVFAISISIWLLGIAGIYGTQVTQFWGSVAFVGASLIAPTLLSFAFSYPVRSPWPPGWTITATLLTGITFAAISLTTNLVIYDIHVTPAGIVRTAGPLYPLFVVYFAVVLCFALAILILKWNNARGIARVQLQYLNAAIVLGAVGPVTTNLALPFLTGLSTYSWVGPFFILVWLALVAHAIIRHRLMDLRLVVHRGLTIALATTLSLLPVAILLLAVWPKLLIDLDAQERALLLGATVVATLLVPLTRDLASWILDRYVYRTHANYRSTVTRASEILTQVLDLRSLLRFISSTVMNSTGADGVAIYLREEADVRLASADRRIEGLSFASPTIAPADVVRVMTSSRELVLADEVARESSGGTTSCLLQHLHENGWALLLPVQADDRLIGIIALGEKLSGDPFYPQDLDLLMTLANQAGIAVKNAQLYAQVLLAKEHIHNILATIESGVVATDAAGRITMFNREAERLTGLTAKALAGQPASQLPGALGALLLTGVTDGTRTVPEINLQPVSTDTAQRAVICTTSPLRDPSGRVLGAVAVFNDLAPLKELETARRQADRLAYFELLASGIAHEIKNPLVSIKTYAQLLPRRLHNDRFIEEFGRIADREIARIEHLLDRLRRLSRPGGRPHEPVDMRQPLKDALESLQAAFEEKGISISASLSASPLFVVGDHSDLESLFFNLLLNAHEATPSHGSVTVDMSQTDDLVSATVADTGPGVPSELRERIFDPFFSTKARGSGLGLALCAGIAQSHRATLRATNREGGGAVFTVELPLAPQSPTPRVRHADEGNVKYRVQA